MKNIFIICLALFGLSLNSHGQAKYGLKGGINYTNIGSNSGDEVYDERQKNASTVKYGYHVGLFLNFPITEKIAFQPELLYTTQGQKNIDFYNFETHLNYLSLPLILEIKVFKKMGIIAGPHINYLLAANYKTEDERSSARFLYDNHWDLGWVGGLFFQLSQKLQLTASYKQGLSTLTKKIFTTEEGGGIVTNNYKNRNQVIQVSFGYKF